jgi:hypothetical protein
LARRWATHDPTCGNSQITFRYSGLRHGKRSLVDAQPPMIHLSKILPPLPGNRSRRRPSLETWAAPGAHPPGDNNKRGRCST